MALDTGLLTFAFSLGVSTFFSPCAVALLPSYVAFFVGTERESAEAVTEDQPSAWRDGLLFGGAATGGILVLFAIGGAMIYALRTRTQTLSGAALLSTFTWIGTGVGVLLVVLGLLMLLDRGLAWTVPIKAPQKRTVPAMAAFGALYAVASMGCTLPLFFGVLGAALAQPPLGSLVTILAFGTGMAVLMLGVSLGLVLAEDQVARRIRQVMPKVKVISAVLLILGGLYIVNFYLGIVPVPSLTL